MPADQPAVALLRPLEIGETVPFFQLEVKESEHDPSLLTKVKASLALRAFKLRFAGAFFSAYFCKLCCARLIQAFYFSSQCLAGHTCVPKKSRTCALSVKCTLISPILTHTAAWCILRGDSSTHSPCILRGGAYSTTLALTNEELLTLNLE